MKPNFDSIPQELKERNQWCLWKLEIKDDKPTKVPYQTNGYKADTTKNTTWTDYQSVCGILEKDKSYAGIGFIFSEDDPYTFIDLDHCIVDGNIEQWALDILKQLHSYSETSQSGSGIHSITKGKLNGNTRHRTGNFEVYDKERYCAITGNRLVGYPIEIQSRQNEIDNIYNQIFTTTKGHALSLTKPPEPITNTNPISAEILIKKIKKARNGAKFEKLMSGDYSDYPSQSEAESALAWIIAYYTHDFDVIESIMRLSAFNRDKWDDNKSYLKTTIQNAIDGVPLGSSATKGHVLSLTNPIVKGADNSIIEESVKPITTIELPSCQFPTIENKICHDYMEIMDSVTEAPTTYHFFTFITCVGMVLAKNAYIQWGMDRIYPNIWTMIVGQTGRARKSSTINKGRDILSKIAPDINVIPMIATWEGLLSAMSRTEEDIGLRNEVTLVCMPEFDGFLKKTRQEQISHLLPYLCDLFDCPDEVRNTTKGTPLCVKNPFFSILAGIQPEVLSKSFQSNDVNGGFAGRFMYVNDSSDKSIPVPIWNKQTEYNKILGELANVRANYKYVHQIKLDDNCIPLWTDFYHIYRNATDNSLLLQLNDRMQIHVLKVAMIFACLENKEFISKEHLTTAIDIGYWLIDNNAKLFGTIGISEKANIELKIMKTLRSGAIDKRTLHLSFNGRISASDFNSAIEGLIKATMIRVRIIKNPRGKPTTVLELCE